MNKRKRKQLVVFFNKKIEEWAKEEEGEHWYLEMKLVNLMSERALFGSNIFWERVVSRVLIKAEEINVSPREIIENLFRQKNSDALISEFQIPNKFLKE